MKDPAVSLYIAQRNYIKSYFVAFDISVHYRCASVHPGLLLLGQQKPLSYSTGMTTAASPFVVVACSSEYERLLAEHPIETTNLRW